MSPFITEVMKAMTWGKTDSVTFLALLWGDGGARQFQSDEALHHRSDEPSHQGLFGPFWSSAL
jgi:hypothetical protein